MQNRDRMIVSAADRMLGMAAAAARPFRVRTSPSGPRHILLLRLERIGDLVMALPAIRDVRQFAPDATIDLVVGSWNRDLAAAIPSVNRVLTMDARWLARDATGAGLMALMRQARAWRSHRYDLGINFEPDIRSNLLLAMSGARWTAGYRTGGGGPVLDFALDYDTRAHTTANAQRLVRRVFGRDAAPADRPLLAIPDSATRRAAAYIPPGTGGPLIGLHVSGGRAIKQWDPERFAEVATRLADDRGATIVLTGSPSDRPMVDRVSTRLAGRSAIDAADDIDLLVLAALLRRLDLLITGDTGPMHLAAAVGTPVVAVFGPSDPIRYAPSGPADRVVRIDLACSPCNRIRLPPARCVGLIPDCLAGVSVNQVLDAAFSSLDETSRRVPLTGRARA